ncbi:MAG: hypothetical protein AAB697_02085 [Patescibacteria group bacterium]
MTTEQKYKNLWLRRTAGVLTFLALLIGGPVVITSAPEAFRILIPTWIVGMLAAGSLSIREG